MDFMFKEQYCFFLQNNKQLSLVSKRMITHGNSAVVTEHITKTGLLDQYKTLPFATDFVLFENNIALQSRLVSSQLNYTGNSIHVNWMAFQWNVNTK